MTKFTSTAMGLVLGALFAGAPVSFVQTSDGMFAVKSSAAFAKDDDDGGRRERDDDRSGRRGGDDRDDHDRDDDHDDDHGGRDDRDDDDHDDDRHGSRGDDDGTDDDMRARTGNRGGGVVLKLEVNGANIEITYTDGWKEEIENGLYELKDNFENTVVERAATRADITRLFKAVR